jgi:type IV pilus assembly protein PilZ
MPGIPSKSSAEGRGQSSAPVELALRSRQEFLAGYDATLPHGGVFCPTRRKANKGAPATVKVNLGRRQPPLVIAGRVVWRRPGRHLQKIRAGICVEFLPTEKAKIDYLLDLAKAGEAVRSRRRHERLPVEIPVNWHLPGSGAPARGILRDIGRGGAFVRSNSPVPSDAEVVLELSPPGAQVAMAFTARVAWTAAQGGEPGFGVEWRARDAGGGKRIRELVRRLTSAAGLV